MRHAYPLNVLSMFDVTVTGFTQISSIQSPFYGLVFVGYVIIQKSGVHSTNVTSLAVAMTSHDYELPALEWGTKTYWPSCLKIHYYPEIEWFCRRKWLFRCFVAHMFVRIPGAACALVLGLWAWHVWLHGKSCRLIVVRQCRRCAEAPSYWSYRSSVQAKHTNRFPYFLF